MKIKAALILLVAGISLTSALLGLSQLISPRPIELELVRFEPISIADDAGRELWLASMRTRHRNFCGLAFRTDKESNLARGKAGNRWIDGVNLWDIPYLPPNSSEWMKREVMILIPPASSLCRVQLRYAAWPWKWRLAERLKHSKRGTQLLQKFPKVATWLSPTRTELDKWESGQLPASTVWKKMAAKFVVPAGVHHPSLEFEISKP